MIKLATNWKDYELLDSGNGEKLERWKDIILRRPDPQAVWETNYKGWDKADAIYHRNKSGGGHWEFKKKLPEFWSINYKNLTTPFCALGNPSFSPKVKGRRIFSQVLPPSVLLLKPMSTCSCKSALLL